jgi:tripartite ATP-independent transporter DctM subunit
VTEAPVDHEPRRGLLTRIENVASILVLAALTLVPLLEITSRRVLGRGASGSIPLVEHLTLWIAFLGAALAARSDRLLSMSTATFLPERARAWSRLFTGTVGTAISAALVWASIDLVMVEREAGGDVALGIPVWIAMSVMPLGFALVGARLAWRASDRAWGRAVAVCGVAFPVALASFPSLEGSGILLPSMIVILLATLLGLPIFAAIGGAALLLFWNQGVPASSVPGEGYRLTASPMLPAVPLFTLGGYILSEGGSSRRLMRLFTALVGWMPGGLAIATTVVLALFTPLTGASGVTILSMGGLLLPMLVSAKYPERFSIGLVTVAGSIGLLLPPSLPVILYGVRSNLSIRDLFIGGLVPGVLLVGMVAAWGVRVGSRTGSSRTPFRAGEALAAAWGARWELLLPVVLLACYFGGYTTLVEAAAVTVLMAVGIECFLHRELSPVHDLPRVTVECATLVGGFLIILGTALGLTDYMVLDEVPVRALDFVRSHIESPVAFLLALNLFLLIVGGMMDIYSAIFVVVPLITPMAAAYGVDPVHLGIIFLANLELGYLTPPMGENLFLSSYRFGRPLPELFRSTLVFWLILMGGVLLITYVPVLTLGPVRLLAR